MGRVIMVLVLGMAMLGGASTAHAAEGLKLAFIDAQKVLDNTKAGKRAKETMEQFRDSRQKIIDLEESEIKRLQDDLARQGAVLSPEARRTKEETLQRRFMDYQKKVGELTKELQDKKKDVLEEFNKGLEEVVKRIAEKNGYTLVFDRNAEGGVLVYAQQSLDITDEVIKEYDKTNP
jgi:outer membrane protein